MDRLRGKAEETLQHAGGTDAVKQGIDKGAHAANKASGGKYKEQVDEAGSKAKEAAGKLSKKKRK